MKRKIDLVEEEHENEYEESESSSDESEDEDPRIKEEPRIKDVLSHLSQAVSEKRASDLLHSMAASKDILFWTSRGQLLPNKRITPLIITLVLGSIFGISVAFSFSIKSLNNFLFLIKPLSIPNSARPSRNVFSPQGLITSLLRGSNTHSTS